MADPPRHTADHTDVEPDPGTATSTPHRRPRWVKVSGIIVGVLVLVFVILQITGLGPGAGGHGPGRHGGGAGTSPPSVTENRGHTPPPGIDHGGRQP